ncbi:hypothetical protein F4777DRAFT_577577 [Nemania sp. FL0916]|nr:hypothetical protein F4777DRAFT_577577 [Nemania sp. FL0916]
MFSGCIALAALSGLTLVSAQANSNSTWKINPSEVDALTQTTWCNAQQDNCNILCGSVLVNNCDPPTLDFSCECAGNSYPDMNKYMNTIPWFVCMQLQSDCIDAHANDAAGQKNCTSTYKDHCGTENVQDHQGEGAASPTPSSSSSSVAPQSTTTQPATTSSSNAAAAPTAHIQVVGNGALAVGLGLLAYAL